MNDEQISVNGIISEILEDFEDRIEEKQITVTNDAEDFMFIGNQTLIRIMLNNLILNAIKYNVQKGSITIKSTVASEHYNLNISDTGIGMTEVQQTKIFERFTRINIEQDGQGLGLAIVDSIANFHHIDIKVTSEVAVGTTFSIQFPV